jgi:hypothetical protein
MDCRTARLFLHFQRPGLRDLDGPEAEELTNHLAHCTECDALSRAEGRLDQHLGRAMRDVPVPEGLRREILHRLASERSEWYRRWFARGGRGLVAAAAVLLLVWGAIALTSRPKRDLDPETVVVWFNVTPPGDAEKANALLASLGAKRCAPDFVNYAFLTGVPAIAALPGAEKVKVPQFVFTRGADKAVIFAVYEGDYQVGTLEDTTQGYKYRLDVYRDPDTPRYAYLILYTGESWDWLRAPRRDR